MINIRSRDLQQTIIRKVILAGAEASGIEAQILTSTSRLRSVVDVRNTLICILYNSNLWRKITLMQIGKGFNRDHSSVLNSIYSFGSLYSTDENYKSQSDKLKSDIEAIIKRKLSVGEPRERRHKSVLDYA